MEYLGKYSFPIGKKLGVHIEEIYISRISQQKCVTENCCVVIKSETKKIFPEVSFLLTTIFKTKQNTKQTPQNK